MLFSHTVLVHQLAYVIGYVLVYVPSYVLGYVAESVVNAQNCDARRITRTD